MSRECSAFPFLVSPVVVDEAFGQSVIEIDIAQSPLHYPIPVVCRFDKPLFRLVYNELLIRSHFISPIEEFAFELYEIRDDVRLESKHAIFPIDFLSALLRSPVKVVDIGGKSKGG